MLITFTAACFPNIRRCRSSAAPMDEPPLVVATLGNSFLKEALEILVTFMTSLFVKDVMSFVIPECDSFSSIRRSVV